MLHPDRQANPDKGTEEETPVPEEIPIPDDVPEAEEIPIPEIIDGTLVSLGRCSTPLIMVFLGMILAESGFSSMISVTNLKYAFLRLVFIPVCVLAACLLLHIDPLVTGLSVLLSAMPAASTTAVLAEQYHADVSFAADCVVFSTILSIAVLPVWTLILNAVC